MPRIPWNWNAIDRLSERAGNYEIIGVIKTRPGQTNNLRRRLKDHYREGTPSHGLLVPTAISYSFETEKRERKRKEREKGGR